MPRNLEIKASVNSLERVREIALRLGAKDMGEMTQKDTYFRSIEGRIKLREIDGKFFELIGYRRGEESTRRMSDYLVVPLSTSEPLKAILTSGMGIRGIVEKRRHLYLLRSTRIHADNVEGLGPFLELETVVRESLTAAEAEMKEILAEFGIAPEDFIKSSYIDLLDRK